jgi:crossover junction endodeoxyribonuclease RuvC
MIVIGLDTSLTHTGFCIINEKGKVLDSGVIKSKPSGDSYLAEVNRIVKIVDEIFEKITKNCKKKPDLAVIEGMAFTARNTTSLVQLAGLNYQLRIQLARFEIPFMIIAPTTLKKFITGSGKGDKDKMMMSVYKNYGFEALDNNECDAASLAFCGLATSGNPVKKLGVPQQEVINLLSKQLL